MWVYGAIIFIKKICYDFSGLNRFVVVALQKELVMTRMGSSRYR